MISAAPYKAGDRWHLRRAAIVITFFFLAFEEAIWWGRAALFEQYAYKFEWFFFIRSNLASIGCCAALYAIFEYFQHRRFWQLAAMVAVLSLLFGWLRMYIGAQFAIADGYTDVETGFLALMSAWWFHFFLAWSAVIVALLYSERIRRERRATGTARRSAHDAQMRAVRYRLNPHFLFNTLNSIGTLILERRSEAAEGLIGRFSAFLRASLKADPYADHTLYAEFEQLRQYLGIEQTRFPDRLRVTVDLPAEIEDALVPPFLLQPLLEDAIQLGVAPVAGETHLDLSAEVIDRALRLKLVERHAQPMPDLERRASRVVGERLTQRFGDRASIDVDRAEDRLTILVRLPVHMGGKGIAA
ncbi:MAG: histidine kinase [Sphingomonas sp.]|nr:histidine kinase [Sphingomonas sp.]RZV49315.1 MAG: hypothetical protein EX258_07625 [Sphingomonadaceae bacterium]